MRVAPFASPPGQQQMLVRWRSRQARLLVSPDEPEYEVTNLVVRSIEAGHQRHVISIRHFGNADIVAKSLSETVVW